MGGGVVITLPPFLCAFLAFAVVLKICILAEVCLKYEFVVAKMGW